MLPLLWLELEGIFFQCGPRNFQAYLPFSKFLFVMHFSLACLHATCKERRQTYMQGYIHPELCETQAGCISRPSYWGHGGFHKIVSGPSVPTGTCSRLETQLCAPCVHATAESVMRNFADIISRAIPYPGMVKHCCVNIHHLAKPRFLGRKFCTRKPRPGPTDP